MNSIQLQKMLQSELIAYSVSLASDVEVDGVHYPSFTIIDESSLPKLGINIVYTPPDDEKYFKAVCRMVRATFEKAREQIPSGDSKEPREQG